MHTRVIYFVHPAFLQQCRYYNAKMFPPWTDTVLNCQEIQRYDVTLKMRNTLHCVKYGLYLPGFPPVI